jgi:hypothetical protein
MVGETIKPFGDADNALACDKNQAVDCDESQAVDCDNSWAIDCDKSRVTDWWGGLFCWFVLYILKRVHARAHAYDTCTIQITHQARAKSVTKKTGLTDGCNEKMPTKKMILTCNTL